MTRKTYIGIDVSRDTLEVHVLESGLHNVFSNDEDGVEALVDWIAPLNPALVILEATGGYEQDAVLSLLESDLPVAVVNPRQVRAYAEGMGVHAKTDRIDAEVLAGFARDVGKKLKPVSQEYASALRPMVDRLGQIIRMRVAEESRLSHLGKRSEFLRNEIMEHIQWLRRKENDLFGAIKEYVQARPELREKVEALVTIRGIGEKTAYMLVAFVPQIGTVNRRKISSLVGLAPFNRDSGPRTGKRRIRGGRRQARAGLYMPTLAAMRFNPSVRALRDRLRARGKPNKVIIIACMRKLLIIANAVVRDHLEAKNQQIREEFSLVA